MKKGLLGGIAIGFVMGAIVAVSVPAYGAVKQYVLTQVAYPIVVNGVAYNDPSRPILNYEGSTYVPLAKLGDLTGVNYTWNDSKQQVEIVVSERDLNPPSGTASQSGVAGRQDDLPDDIEVIEADVPGYKGHADWEDPSYKWAEGMGRAADDFPPLLSEGWISSAMLDEIESIYVGGTDIPFEVIISNKSFANNHVVYKTFSLPSDYDVNKKQSFEVKGIRIINYYGNLFFSIRDLQEKGIIKA